MKLLSSIIPYLLLVSFSSGQFTDFDKKKINIINHSPYRGVALQVKKAYDCDKHTIDEFNSQVSFLKENCQKDIWPWLFLNRFVGYDPNGNSLSAKSNKGCFLKIKGMDLFNQNGALQAFYDMWKIALKLAKDLNSPGILVDPELYNNYRTKDLSYLAEKLGKTKEEIKERLKQIGSELIEMAQPILPEAKIWFLTTGLGATKYVSGSQQEYELSFSYLIEGMLKTIKERKLKNIIIAGGESYPWGYCYEGLDILNNKINQRYTSFGPKRQEFSNLVLGGTIAPWAKAELKQSWMLTREECKSSPQKTISDFKPYLNSLFSSYKYVWIYAASAAGYDPYNLAIYPGINQVISESLQSLTGTTTLKAPSNIHVLNIAY